MEITLNGEPRDVPDACTVDQLLQHLGVPAVRVAVEVNLDIVPKARHSEHRLTAGDEVEVVSFVGGG